MVPVGGCLGARAHTVPEIPHSNLAQQTAVEVAEMQFALSEPQRTETPPHEPRTDRPQELQYQAESRDWKYIVLHHSATESGNVDSIDREHRKRRDQSGNPWLGIAYHFVIGNGEGMADGHIEPTFRWTQQLHGAHAGEADYNEHGIGICLIGNFDEHPPTARQMASTTRLIRALHREFHIAPDHMLPHHELKATACPGRHFPWEHVAESIGGIEPNAADREVASN